MSTYSCKLILALVLLTLYGYNIGESNATILNNSGFDTTTNSLPDGWHIDNNVKNKGSISVVTGIQGANDKSLQLKPNLKNHGELLGLGQLLDATSLRGKILEISVKLGAEGEANAIVGVHVLGNDGDMGFVQIRQEDSNGLLIEHKRILAVPENAKSIVVYTIVKGLSGKALFDSLDIISTDVNSIKTEKSPAAMSNDVSASINVNVNQKIRDIPNTLFGSNIEWIFNGQGLWSEEKNGLSTQAINMTQDMGVSLLRFPGGVFSDYYHWQDGIGDHSKRRTTLHYPGGPRSKHNFGVIEANYFAKKTGAKLLITVNAGTGTAHEAAAWVDFMNIRRAAKGPSVKYWEIGNELYMKGDLSGAHLSPTEYAVRFEEFADAMLAVDPSIKIGAIGGLNYGNYSFIDNNRWTEILLKKAADKIDFLAVHNAYAPVLMGGSKTETPAEVYDAVMVANIQIEKNLADVSTLLDKYETSDKEISIAITEWGPFYHVLPSSPWVDHVKTMGSAIFVASTMNSFLRNPKVKIANFFKLTDHGFMGWIGNKDGNFMATAPYYVFSLYSNGLGKSLVQSFVKSPTLNTKSVGVIKAMKKAPALDVIATRDKDQIILAIVNRHQTSNIKTSITLQGVKQYGNVQAHIITGTAVDSHTGTELPDIPRLTWGKQVNVKRFNYGSPNEIKLLNESFPASSRLPTQQLIFEYNFLPMSVTHLLFRDVQM